MDCVQLVFCCTLLVRVCWMVGWLDWHHEYLLSLYLIFRDRERDWVSPVCRASLGRSLRCQFPLELSHLSCQSSVSAPCLLTNWLNYSTIQPTRQLTDWLSLSLSLPLSLALSKFIAKRIKILIAESANPSYELWVEMSIKKVSLSLT